MTPDTIQQALQTISQGDISLHGLVTWGSNYTFLGDVCIAGVETPVIYKPRRGERPLWDFPTGTLCDRERAAFVVSEFLGWHIVPPTVLRDGPHGVGSVQLFIPHDPNIHYFSIEGDVRFRSQLQRIVLFDYITNNADRKAGHVLIEYADDDDAAAANVLSERLWAIDHGICFHAEYKLRSVIWEYAGDPIEAELIDDLTRLRDDLRSDRSRLRDALQTHLLTEEIVAMQRRVQRLLKQAHYPQPGPGRPYPWPMV